MPTNILEALRNIDITKEGIIGSLSNAIKPTGEPQKGFMWEVHFKGTGNQPKFEDAQFYARTVTIPASSNDVIERKYLGQRFTYVGGQSSPKELTITFWDDQQMSVTRYLHQWFYTMHTMKTGRSVGDSGEFSYRRNIEILLKDTSDLFETARITLEGAFIININDIDLNYDNSDEIQITAQFSYLNKYVGQNIEEELE